MTLVFLLWQSRQLDLKPRKCLHPTIPPIPIAMASLRVILEFTVFLEFISFTLKLVCPNWNFNKTLIVPFDL